jgi:hypothetical protein
MTIPPLLETLLRVERTGLINIGQGPEDTDATVAWLTENGLLVADPGYRVTDRGKAWLVMAAETPLPVQQWIDPRASNGHVYDWKRVDSTNLGEPRNMGVEVDDKGRGKFVDALPPLPDGFTAWGGKLGTVFDPGLKADVKVTVPNGIGVDTNVVVFQRNGQVRNVKGQQRFPAGTINWDWAKEPVNDPMQDATAAKRMRDRFARQQAEDVIGYAIIPGEDDHLRRDIK